MSSNCKTKAAFTLNTHTHTDEVSGTYTELDTEVNHGCLSWHWVLKTLGTM